MQARTKVLYVWFTKGLNCSISCQRMSVYCVATACTSKHQRKNAYTSGLLMSNDILVSSELFPQRKPCLHARNGHDALVPPTKGRDVNDDIIR